MHPLQCAGQATGHGVTGLVGTRTGRSSCVSVTMLPWADTTPAATPCVPTCPLSSFATKCAMTQLQHLLPTPPTPAAVGSLCHYGLLVPLAVLCECCPASYYHRKSCNTTANLPAQPCYKSGSGGSAVRQSLPVRAPAPNVLLPHT